MRSTTTGAEYSRRLVRIIRGEKVMLHTDAAALYGIEARALIGAVKRSMKCFPADCMFKLTMKEAREVGLGGL